MKASSCEAAPGGCGREQGAVWWLRGLLLGHRLVDHAHDVGLLHDQEILAVDLDLGARPLAEQHAVADLDVDRNELAGFVAATRANSDDFALGRLLLGGVGNDDASGRLRLGVDALDDYAVVKRTKLHGILHKFLVRLIFLSEGRRQESPRLPSRTALMRPMPSIKRGDGSFLALIEADC